jgi:Domain of unknown function (DUF4335)
MLSSHSVIRRYTPPTCTLEILAKSSPLSFWVGRTLLKELRFKLSFDDPKIIQEKPVTISGDRQQLEMLGDVVTTYVKNFLQQPVSTVALTAKSSLHNGDRKSVQTTPVVDVKSNETYPFIKHHGMLAHELFFGSLASETSGEKIELSALQLFDLATALDKYDSEIDALPNLVAGDRKGALPIWASAAAAIVLAVGLTSTGIRLFGQKSTPSTNSVASSDSRGDDNNERELSDVIPPKPAEPKATPSPKLPETLASAERLPPPPPVDLPKPPPANVPDPSKYPFPSKAFKIAQPPQPTVAIAPNSSNKTPTPQPPTEKTNLNQSDRETVKLPALPPLVRQSPNTNSKISESGERGEEDNLASDSLNSGDRVRLTAAANSDPENAVERIPQLVELQNYFQQRWKPPQGLTQTLEYRLILNNNGSIKSIIPLGKASEINLDRTNIPLMGESFISPFQERSTPIVRLVLGPDGAVKTFTE